MIATPNVEAHAAVTPQHGKALPSHWPTVTRIAFRFAFAYFAQYALCSGPKTVLDRLPLLGHPLQGLLSAPYAAASLWLAKHAFHLTGASIRAHGTGFGDRAADWISAGLMLAVALVATVLWTALDRRRREYRTLYAWLRFGLRLTLGISMLWYASIKIFPIQIETPSLAVLNEPLGNLSPMSLLWATLAFSKGYERVCGVAELLGGVLILVRRTALIGTLMTSIVVLNIVLFNLFFDVAVKLYAINLLLMTLVILAPDIPVMLRFFLRLGPARLTTDWVPPAQRKSFRTATVAIEVVFLLTCFWPMRASYRQFHLEQANEAHPSPLTGQWHVTSSTLHDASFPFVTGDGSPMSDLFLEPSGRDSERSSDGALWLGGRYDRTPGEIELLTPGRGPLIYTLSTPDAGTMVLTPAPADASSFPVLRLSRVPVNTHFPLYERGFHWINEWGFER